jgi:hypothetical protein
MDALGREGMGADRLDQRHQCGRRGAHPLGQCRHIEINSFPRMDVALPIERQMQAILGEQDVGEQFGASAPERDRVRRGGRLADCFTNPTGELLRHVLDDCPLARNQLQRLGYILADLAQSRSATARADSRSRIDDALPCQMPGQRTACRPALLEWSHRYLFGATAAISAAASACAASACKSVHGGYAATLLDSCMELAIRSTLGKGSGSTTLEFKI